MGLVARVAGKTVGVIGGNYLRKTLGLCRIRLMAADAEHGRIELWGSYGSRIVRVLGQRPVTGLAIHVRVLAIFFLFEDVGMAGFAGLVPGEVHRPGRDFRQCIAPIVPILAETFGDQKSAEDQKQENACDEDSGQSKKMSRILKNIHGMLSAKRPLFPSFLCLCPQREPDAYRYSSQLQEAVRRITGKTYTAHMG